MPEEVYSPGDAVPQTGVYRVTHQGHRAEHDATLLDGGHFPQCSRCGEQVRFQLVRAAARIARDRDFEVNNG